MSSAAPPPASTPAAQQAIADSISAALQGDAQRSLAALGAVTADQFVGADADYRSCMFGRFRRDTPPYLAGAAADPLVRQALTLYQDYWWHALAAPSTRDASDAQLQQQLRALFGDGPGEDWDVLEDRLTRRLVERGYHAQLGRTPPLRELMIWHRQTSKPYDVALPDGSTHHVDVELLDDFVSLGWSAYARCGRGSTGGWAADDRVYAVSAWFGGDLGSDQFRASLLGHETQHFADYKRFASLQPWELEYRAKFTEIWASRQTLRKLLTKFAASQSDDKESPHTYANRRVLSALRAQLAAEGIAAAQPDLGDAPPDALRAAARTVLLEDSRRRAEAAATPPRSPAGTSGG